jgi:hypothetical protein
MAVEERRRIELFERVTATIGPEATATMFDLFPPGDDHVTRRDLQGAAERVGATVTFGIGGLAVILAQLR